MPQIEPKVKLKKTTKAGNEHTVDSFVNMPISRRPWSNDYKSCLVIFSFNKRAGTFPHTLCFAKDSNLAFRILLNKRRRRKIGSEITHTRQFHCPAKPKFLDRNTPSQPTPRVKTLNEENDDEKLKRKTRNCESLRKKLSKYSRNNMYRLPYSFG